MTFFGGEATAEVSLRFSGEVSASLTAARMRLSIQACMGLRADGAMVERRVTILEERFSNYRNAEAIVKLLS